MLKKDKKKVHVPFGEQKLIKKIPQKTNRIMNLPYLQKLIFLKINKS